MLFKEILLFAVRIVKTHMDLNILCGQNARFLNVEAGGTHSNTVL
jgi:hypothetical protein